MSKILSCFSSKGWGGMGGISSTTHPYSTPTSELFSISKFWPCFGAIQDLLFKRSFLNLWGLGSRMKVVDSDSGWPGTLKGTAGEVMGLAWCSGVMPTASQCLEQGPRATNREGVQWEYCIQEQCCLAGMLASHDCLWTLRLSSPSWEWKSSRSSLGF